MSLRANPIDWRIRSGSLRMLLPARFPLVLGFDASGEIVETGPAARQQGWQVGDEVMCFLDARHGGGYAEYAVVRADLIARKPVGLSHEEAAAVPLAASTALQALRDLGNIAPASEVLVNGASGGVGTFAVQIGKDLGGRVTGVCSGQNADFVRGLGATQVIDYTREDFTRSVHRYDIIFDAVAKSSYWKCRHLLKNGGTYITTLPRMGSLFSQLASTILRSRCRNIIVRRFGEDLKLLSQMIEEGKVRPIIQDVYPLDDVAAAHLTSESGHVRGKLAITIDR